MLRTGFFFLAALLGNQVEAAQLEQFRVGNWTAAAYTDDQSGQFSHCIAVAGYNSGIAMIFAVNRTYGWSLSFGNHAWQLPKGAVYDISLSIDGAPPLFDKVTSVSSELVILNLPDSAPLFSRFQKGYTLSVSAAGQEFRFNLDGTYAVLDALVQCVRQHTALATVPAAPAASNPFAPAPQSLPSPGSNPAFRAEAIALTANILSQSGIEGFHILSPTEVPQEFTTWDSVWRAGEITGLIRIIPPEANIRLQEAPAGLIAADAKSCSAGKFVSGSMPDQFDSDQIARAFSSCQTSTSQLTQFYLFVPRPSSLSDLARLVRIV